jgi:hypothetical protein
MISLWWSSSMKCAIHVAFFACTSGATGVLPKLSSPKLEKLLHCIQS